MTALQDGWIQTYTGKKFYCFDPKPEDICIEDIAHSLSLTNRFNGHTCEAYSVAQHSLHVLGLVVRLVQNLNFPFYPQAQLCALLHDAPEAYMGDLLRPIKAGMLDFVAAENKIWACVLERFGLDGFWRDTVISAYVKQADDIALFTERRDLLPAQLDWGWYVEPDPKTTVPLSSAKVEELFLERFHALSKEEK